jgi:hypothetical protein
MPVQQDADVASPVYSGQAPVAGVNPPQAREPGLDPQPRLDRRRIGAWYAMFAGYAPRALGSDRDGRALRIDGGRGITGRFGPMLAEALRQADQQRRS